MKKTKIINLFAGPGAGKSTVASGLFHEMKKRYILNVTPLMSFQKNWLGMNLIKK